MLQSEVVNLSAASEIYPHTLPCKAYASLWAERLLQNRRDRPEPNWKLPLHLDEPKRAALALSLAEYQLGDGGGPCRLIAHDAEFFRMSADEIRQVVDLWFLEEKEHSRLLAEAVTRLGGDFVHETFAFRAFCSVRRLLGVQFEMLVLLLVEIVSVGYYRVIRRHCGDQPIADMCRLILRDEQGHIAFHLDRLAESDSRAGGLLWRLRFYLLGYACTAFLWLGHGRWLRILGAERRELFRHAGRGMHAFLLKLPRRARAVRSAPLPAEVFCKTPPQRA